MTLMYYRGIKITYDPTYACFDFQVDGHSFTTLQYSSVYAIIDSYLEA